MSSLQKCQPAEETKTLLFFNETVKIIGFKKPSLPTAVQKL